jgi:ABC-2 type transport system ATP-binding protein
MLAVESLAKRYDPAPPWLRLLSRTASPVPVEALRGVSLEVAAGEIVGIIGPNGAGKTTLIKVVVGLLEATSGRVLVEGVDATHERVAARGRIGIVLADDRGFYWRLSGRQNLEFFAALAGVPASGRRSRVDELLELVGLGQRDKLVFGYSSGMRSRLAIARALLSDPPLLILDEPTRSLDPLAAADTGRVLRDLAGRGHAVLLASHRLDEVTAVCDRAIVLIEGQVRQVVSRQQLTEGAAWDSADLAALLEREVRRR